MNRVKPFGVYQELIGVIDPNPTDVADLDDISFCFENYKNRPEYVLSTRISTDNLSADTMKETYKQWFLGCQMIRAFRVSEIDNIEIIQSRVNKCLKWLDSTDFFTCPASTIYHESEPNGLLKHCLNVVSAVQDLYSCDAFQGARVESAIFAALVHDWCKIGFYEQYERNVKNAEGRWEQIQAYRRNKELPGLGHAVDSLFKAMQFFRVTTEEAMAIRWHMGRWNVCDGEIDEFQNANENYPLVHLVQFADQLATTRYALQVRK